MAVSPKRAPTLNEQLIEFKKNAAKPPEVPESINQAPISQTYQHHANDTSSNNVTISPPTGSNGTPTNTTVSLLNKLLQRKQSADGED